MFNIGIVSLHANPLHLGHLDYISAADRRSDHLFCIINNDHQIVLRGDVPLMPEDHRVMMMGYIKGVDSALLSIDKDGSVCETLKKIHGLSQGAKLTFYNSGDRSPENQDSKESEVCEALGISQVYLPLPKIWSSSEMRKRLRDDFG